MAVEDLNCCASSGEGDHQGRTSVENGQAGSSADCLRRAVIRRKTGMVTVAGPIKAGSGETLCFRRSLASSALSCRTEHTM